MRKKFLFIAIAIALAMYALVACKADNLVDFPATQTIEAQKLGDTYELRRTVKDEAGNSHDLDFDVKTAAGDSVTVVAAKFDLTDPG